ncbi:hypothetical protein AHMF7605_21695 [Adhaeribacter arboris]|uniref:Uncharacterized protein n=1 Tax=Adhaeribacter arboris TaxID=2072846 RepID=A0A2T2YK99_9BACT|nr:hypothetical protein [Adhaeribacter arboris]PSR55928.1 hypothetical protein AHMF7605_21695 [Adhaeribacter arboris]
MITHRTFNYLPVPDKLMYLKGKGTVIAIRYTHVFEIKLYYLNNFFVEVYYHLLGQQCDYIGTFHSTSWLEPYLDHIKLDLDL